MTLRRLVLVGAAAVALAACAATDIPKQLKPVPGTLVAKMDQLGMKETGEIFIRIFKESSELEVWKERRDGKYALLHTYHVCKWSGVLGPKLAEGDRQAPEGFYTVTPAQMNPNSDFYLSFNIGYPNTFDKALGRTGSHLMVHGACSSAGCYSMTDEDAGEIFALARDAFKGGQRAFQIQAFPFRMTAENFARHRDNPNMTFWQNLKEGHEHFELTRVPPKVDVCDRRYVFNASAEGGSFNPTASCPAYSVPPALQNAVVANLATHERNLAVEIAKLERSGTPAQPSTATQQTSSGGLLSRFLNRGERRTAQPAATPVRIEQGSAAASFAAGPSPVAVAPVPTRRPGSAPVTTGAVAAVPPPVQPAPQPAPAPAQTADSSTLTSTSPIQPPGEAGRFIKREFYWPES